MSHWLRRRNLNQIASTKTGAIQRVGALAERYHGHMCFDREVLESYYRTAVSLSEFVVKNSGIKLKFDPYDYQRASALLAVCALMLFVSDQDINLAIAKFAKLIKSPGPIDDSLGNVVGLNPFHDYQAWKILRLCHELSSSLVHDWDYEAQLVVLEEGLRKQHCDWRTSQTLV